MQLIFYLSSLLVLLPFSTYSFSTSTDEFKWIQLLGSTGLGNYTWGGGLAIDKMNNVWMMGQTNQNLFNPKTGAYDYYLVGYDRNGQMVCGTQNGPYPSVGNSIASSHPGGVLIDSEGYLYVVGWVEDGYFPNQTTVTGNDYYIAKYTTNCTLLWLRQSGFSNFSVYRPSIAIDAQNNLYLASDLPVNFPVYGLYAISKYSSSNGDLIWSKVVSHSDNSSIVTGGISLDKEGNIYVTGSTWEFDVSMIYFISKFNSVGDLVWSTLGPTGGVTSTSSIAIDSMGFLYVLGTATMSVWDQSQIGDQDYFLVCYDSSNGLLQWTRQGGALGAIIQSGVLLYYPLTNTIFLTGMTSNHSMIPNQPLIGVYDMFVVQYDRKGNLLSTQEYGIPDYGIYDYSLQMDADGSQYFGCVKQGDPNVFQGCLIKA